MIRKSRIWIGVFGFGLLAQLFLGYGNRTILADQRSDIYILQQESETVTGIAMTATASAVATASTIAEIQTNTQVEETTWSEGNVAVTDSENEIEANLKEENLQLGMGEQVKMPINNHSGLHVTYKSKNKQVVSINRKGIIRGRKLGKTEVYATISTKILMLKIQVRKKPKTIKIKVPKLSSVNIGTKIPLKVTLNKGAASYKIRWASSKKSVATVNASGILLVKGRGRTVITARTYNGRKAKIVFALH